MRRDEVLRNGQIYTPVIIHRWPKDKNHIALEIQYCIGELDMIVSSASSNRYFSFDDQKKQIVSRREDDIACFGLPSTTVTFHTLCVDDIIRKYKKLSKYYNTGDSTSNVTSVRFVHELLLGAGLPELSKYYVTGPTLTKSFILLIAAGLLLFAENDVAKIIGAALLASCFMLWTAGCYQRRTDLDCCGEMKLDADNYYTHVLMPARHVDSMRSLKGIPALREGRNNIGSSGMLCSLLGLMTGGGILAGLPDKFIFGSTASIVIGSITIGFGCLCCAFCCQLTRAFQPKGVSNWDEESRVNLTELKEAFKEGWETDGGRLRQLSIITTNPVGGTEPDSPVSRDNYYKEVTNDSPPPSPTL